MSNQLNVSRRLSSAAALATAAVLSVGGAARGADTIAASDDVTVRPSAASQHGSGGTGLFIKNATGNGNNGSDAVGFMEFAVPKATYPTGVRSAVLTVVPTAMYFVQTTPTPVSLQSYNAQMDFRVFGLPDAHPNENFDEAVLRGNGWTSLNTSVSAVNVGPSDNNNGGSIHGLFNNGFTLNPRATDTANYTAQPGWIAVEAGAGSVADANAGGTDAFTYTYISATQADVANKQPGGDGVPDASQENMAGTAANNLTVDVSDFINTFDNNGTVTLALQRATQGDGGASFFARTPTLVVEAGIPVFWDTDGANPGAGGAAPAGTWDGAATNFNTDATGGPSGQITPLVTAADTVVFGAGGDATGSYTVTLSGARKAWQVNIEDGNVTLTGGTLATNAVDVAAGASGTIASTVLGGRTGSFTKSGAGTLTLTANNTYTGGTNVQAGALRVTRLHENNAVNITGGKLQVMDSSPTLPAHPAGDNAFVSRPSALTIANNGAALGSRTYDGQLDLGNNDLILDYDGASNLAEIEDMVRAGYNGGDWLGNGITSSTANANRNFAIGVADNARLTIPFDATRPFSGQTVDSTTILVKFTHRIDLDLDGVITTNDATIFNSNYSEGAPAYWSIGDLDYDRVFTTNDATLFNSFYSEALASVPEPTTLGVLGIGALGLLGRRRRGA